MNEGCRFHVSKIPVLERTVYSGMKFAAGILMGIVVCYSGRGQDQYKSYCNTRFIFCIDYPADFIGEGEAGNGDGHYPKREFA